MTEEQIKKLPKHRLDWLECWGNTWAPKAARPGTCTACVWNRGEHSDTCVTREKAAS